MYIQDGLVWRLGKASHNARGDVAIDIDDCLHDDFFGA